MRLTVLMGLTAWCHAEHPVRPSLLQLSGRQTAMGKAEAESRSQTLAGFQKFANSLVEQYKSGQAPMEMDDTTADAIKSVLAYIDTFFPHAVVAHNQDEAAIEACTDQTCQKGCPGEFDHDSVNTEKSRLALQENNMKTCFEEFKSNCEQSNAACDLYDYYRQNVEMPECVYEGKYEEQNFCNAAEGSYNGDFCDNMIQAPIDSAELEAMEDCLVAFEQWFMGGGEAWRDPNDSYMQDHYEGMYQLYQGCTRQIEQGLECQESVTEYHRDHCEHALVLNHNCQNYEKCISNCNNNCEICDDILIKAGARKADNETGERIKCLLNVLINVTKTDKPTELDACLNDAAVAQYKTWADYFSLTCDDAFVPDPESQLPPGTCDDAFQPISCSNDYMNALLDLVVIEGGAGQLRMKDFDQSSSTGPGTKCTEPVWNSCACGHQCTAAADQDGPNGPNGYFETSGKCFETQDE